jgi:RNA polymerase sigma-70 factor (ECF subfamily)
MGTSSGMPGLIEQHSVAWEDSTDEDLVEAALEDLEAFGELVRRHQDFVYGAALRVVRNKSLAEDLAQETFLRAHRGLEGFRGDAKVRSWLYRIATNLALNAVTRRREFPAEDVPDTPVPWGPAAEAEASELREHLRTAIENLPESLRGPLVLREYHEMSYDEIATATGLPLNTVRTRILRARRALRADMEAWR